MPFFKRFKKHKQPQPTAIAPKVEDGKDDDSNITAAAQPVTVQSSVDSEDVELCLEDAECRTSKPTTAPATTTTTSHMNMNMQAEFVRSQSAVSSEAHYDANASSHYEDYDDDDEEDESVCSRRSSDDDSDDDDDCYSSGNYSADNASSVDDEHEDYEDEGASTVLYSNSRDDDDSMTIYSTTLQQPKQQQQQRKQKGSASTTPLSWNTLLGCNGAGCLNPAATEEAIVKQQQQSLLTQDLNCSHTQSFTSYEDGDDDEDAEYIIYEGEEEEGDDEESEMAGPPTLRASNRAKSFRKDAQIDWMKKNMNGLVELAKNMPGA
mmetsp:Transcript_27125/g.42156  ORF Transcript_27125/g.42156 Transcript_27125/m.42156 type:complete len:321 (-) Transcript_27125:292-1254(-)|eukprot:CAMPEP_0196802774 /NCGR_PEP_ID=MMETSP1362-20130617/2333_1 /TAXON_ID=163516 /ORGANISM="Leptocylindrus danicus, Strain CCMP1856" /LENGTH=320 /DNA_ID=CAMNT_0042174167 /DNA_START=12 /DNA_END=974 /DNA_ORIENTATION=-